MLSWGCIMYVPMLMFTILNHVKIASLFDFLDERAHLSVFSSENAVQANAGSSGSPTRNLEKILSPPMELLLSFGCAALSGNANEV